MVLPDDGYARATLGYVGTNVPRGAANVLCFDISSFAGTLTDLANELADNWGDNIMPNLTNDVTLSSVLIKQGPDATGPSVAVSASRPGTIVADSNAPSTSYLVHKNTPAGGHAGKGRVFLPGTRDSVVDDSGVLGSGTITSFNANLLIFFTRAVTNFYIPVLEHKDTALFPTPTTMLSMTVDATVATQRRRLRR